MSCYRVNAGIQQSDACHAGRRQAENFQGDATTHGVSDDREALRGLRQDVLGHLYEAGETFESEDLDRLPASQSSQCLERVLPDLRIAQQA
jgi:hypothetical protein